MKIQMIAMCLVFALLLSACGATVAPTEPSTRPETQPTETTTTATTDQPTETTTQSTESATDSTEATTQPTESATQPTECTTESTVPSTQPTTPGGTVDSTSMTYEEYMAMTAEKQQAFFESFESVEAFFSWLAEAQAAYEESQGRIEIGGNGNVDIGDLLGGSNGSSNSEGNES